MPIDLSPYLDPSQSAVIVFECQENVIGSGSRIPGLVASVQERGVLPRIAKLLADARAAGVSVFYCIAATGGLGSAKTPLLDRMRDSPTAGGGDASDTSVVPEIAPEPGDLVISRSHGMSGFYYTGLDPCLRDLGVRTVVVTGVSLNIGVIGTAIEAVNHGYRAVVPADCVAGDPPEYGDQLLRYSLRNLAYVTTSDQIAEIWAAR